MRLAHETPIRHPPRETRSDEELLKDLLVLMARLLVTKLIIPWVLT